MATAASAAATPPVGFQLPSLNCCTLSLPRVPQRYVLPDTTHIIIQRIFLVASVLCFAVSATPGCGFAANLAGRAIGCIAISFKGSQQWNERTTWQKTALVMHVATAILGIAALVAASPVLFLASLASDAAMRVIEIHKNVRRGNVAGALFHAAILTADLLAITAIVKGSGELLAISTIVASATILGMVAYLVFSHCYKTGCLQSSNAGSYTHDEAKIYNRNVIDLQLAAQWTGF